MLHDDLFCAPNLSPARTRLLGTVPPLHLILRSLSTQVLHLEARLDISLNSSKTTLTLTANIPFVQSVRFVGAPIATGKRMLSDTYANHAAVLKCALKRRAETGYTDHNKTYELFDDGPHADGDAFVQLVSSLTKIHGSDDL